MRGLSLQWWRIVRKAGIRGEAAGGYREFLKYGQFSAAKLLYSI